MEPTHSIVGSDGATAHIRPTGSGYEVRFGYTTAGAFTPSPVKPARQYIKPGSAMMAARAWVEA
jgi:hypothetical protein